MGKLGKNNRKKQKKDLLLSWYVKKTLNKQFVNPVMKVNT